MQNTPQRTQFLIGTGIVLVVIGAILVLRSNGTPPAPAGESAATSTEPTATTTPPQPTAKAPSAPFALDSRDTVASWTISGPYAADPTAKQTEIAQLSSEIGTGIYPDYDILVGIAQDYELIGDGKNAFAYYVRATTADPSRGLAYNDLGNLSVKLGAFNTAKNAYVKSVALEPSVPAFQFNYLDFLTARYPTASATAKAFAAARVALKASPDFLIKEATWLEAIGNIQGAINDWEAVRSQVPPAQQTAIDTKIAKLQSKL